MERFKSLREVCVELGISRRTVQGYEKKGLIKASSRNKYGHLLYDQETVKRIAFIRFCQHIGFSVNEISEFFDSSVETIKEKVTGRLDHLFHKQTTLQNLIRIIEDLSNVTEKDDYLNKVLSVISQISCEETPAEK